MHREGSKWPLIHQIRHNYYLTLWINIVIVAPSLTNALYEIRAYRKLSVHNQRACECQNLTFFLKVQKIVGTCLVQAITPRPIKYRTLITTYLNIKEKI